LSGERGADRIFVGGLETKSMWEWGLFKSVLKVRIQGHSGSVQLCLREVLFLLHSSRCWTLVFSLLVGRTHIHCSFSVLFLFNIWYLL
jgi:hypothetical protein